MDDKIVQTNAFRKLLIQIKLNLVENLVND